MLKLKDWRTKNILARELTPGGGLKEEEPKQLSCQMKEVKPVRHKIQKIE